MLAELVEPLRAGVVPPGFDEDSSESVMGTVASDHVRLERNQPWPRIQPRRVYFVGSFQPDNQGAVLSGRFVAPRWTNFFVRTIAGASFFGPSPFRNDVVWLSNFIEQALAQPPNNLLIPVSNTPLPAAEPCRGD